MYQETKEEFKKRIREAMCSCCVFCSGHLCSYNPEIVMCSGWCAHFVKGNYQDPE